MRAAYLRVKFFESHINHENSLKASRGMSKHITIATLAARQSGTLPQAQEQQVREHLATCSLCAELAQTLTSLGKNFAPPKESTVLEESACLTPEVFANYMNEKLSWWQRRKMHEHLGGCANCRSTLVAMLRMANTALDEADMNWLHSLPAFVPKPLASSSPPSQPSRLWPRAGIWAGIKNMFYERSVPAFAVAFAMVLLLIGNFVFPDWQSRRLAQQGMEELALRYEIAQEGLRPAGNFQPALLSGARSAAQIPNAEKAREKLQSSLRWDDTNALAQRGQALQAFFDKDSTTAIRLLRELLVKAPNDAEALNDLGVVIGAHAPEQALQYLERALALQPNLPAARFNRAYLLQKMLRLEAARQAWQEYMQLNEATAWEHFAKLQLRQLE